jgi:hypothetical protein
LAQILSIQKSKGPNCEQILTQRNLLALCTSQLKTTQNNEFNKIKFESISQEIQLFIQSKSFKSENEGQV